jgi:hypothetical protein
MNLRLAQGLFHDEWMKEQPFDPDRNTSALIQALDFYKSHGVLMVNVSLQGGQAGYDPKVNGVDRENGYKFGPEKGTHVSAFWPNGSLKSAWLDRLEALLRAADQRGMFVNIMLFYQGQDELFESTGAMHAAARNTARWLVDSKFRNVLIDVANEYDLATRWDHESYIPKNTPRIVQEMQQEFRAKGFLTPVTTSSDGRMRFPEPLLSIADVVLIHGNNRTVEQKTSRAAELASVGKPVLMNEDDNGRASTVENLEKELKSCDIFFKHAGGWGYMPWVQAQRFPFRYLPGKANTVLDTDPEKERDMAYMHAVLDHIASLTMQRPPHGGGR